MKAQARLASPVPARPATPVEDRTHYRGVMSTLTSGVVVVTVGGDDAHGMTANSVTSVSLDPPMLLACVNRTARMHAAIEGAGCFAVSVLAGDQRPVADHFSDRTRPPGAAQFHGLDVVPGRLTGAPLVAHALAWFECRLNSTYPGGDHSIFLADVLSAECDLRRAPRARGLAYFRSAYHEPQQLPPAPSSPPSSLPLRMTAW